MCLKFRDGDRNSNVPPKENVLLSHRTSPSLTYQNTVSVPIIRSYCFMYLLGGSTWPGPYHKGGFGGSNLPQNIFVMLRENNYLCIKNNRLPILFGYDRVQMSEDD